MATIKLAPAPIFKINRKGEIVDADYNGLYQIIECKVIQIYKESFKCLTLKEIVEHISENHNIENVYVLSVESSFSAYIVHYGYHSNF